MSEHATLAPSAAEQWANCSGSVRAQAAFPNLDSEAAREGTAAHWVVSETLLSLKLPDRNAVCCSDFLGKVAPNGVLINEKAINGAQIMVDDVVKTVSSLSEEIGRNLWDDVLIEHRVFMPSIHPSENWGTLDCALFCPELPAIYIWDYKHGHRERRAEGDLQLINYIAGLADTYRVARCKDSSISVFARIVQPFCYSDTGPVNEWRTSLEGLHDNFDDMRDKAEEALSKRPTLTTGKHCRDCRAVGVCSAARQMSYNLIDVVEAPYKIDDMQGSDLAIERYILQDGLAVAKARLDAIEDELHDRIAKGDTSTGLTVETTGGRLEWTIPVAQAIALANQFGVDVSKPGVLTPTQTKAKAPKEVRPLLNRVLGDVTRRNTGKLKLVDASNSIGARAFERK